MTKTKLIPLEELYEKNTIGVKLVEQTRSYQTALAGEKIEKKISRTKYLKVCCSCGKPYESHKYNSYACGHRCRQNIIYRRKKGLNPLGNIEQLTKEKRIREIKERLGYL
ncbi:MAG TPA: hypothetical protein DEA97_17585 [Bacteroidales bacterium]|nr:hypothetical protein [Bacteroidales bacterium]